MVGYCGVVNVVVVVTAFVRVAILLMYKSYSLVMFCYGGSFIGGVVLVVVIMVWY